jgi:hypothetical protein
MLRISTSLLSAGVDIDAFIVIDQLRIARVAFTAEELSVPRDMVTSYNEILNTRTL